MKYWGLVARNLQGFRVVAFSILGLGSVIGISEMD